MESQSGSVSIVVPAHLSSITILWAQPEITCVCVLESGTGGFKGKEVELRVKNGMDAPGSLTPSAEMNASGRDPI